MTPRRGGTEPGLTYAHVARLPVAIERCELLPLVRDTSSGFTKVSIVVRLSGEGHDGEGEDITWDQIDQIEFLRGGSRPHLAAGGPHVRRVLDAARPGRPLPGRTDPRQRPLLPPVGVRERGAGPRPAPERALAARRHRPSGPAGQFRGVGPDRGPSEPRPAARRCSAATPGLRFKLDPTAGWDDDLVGELARLGCVDVVDLKGRYRNANVAMDPEAGLYRRVIEGLADAWIEDPALDDSTAGLLERHRDRITWDEPIHAVGDIEALPWRPRMLNLKPARFGSVRALFDIYDYCAAHGIGAYGGGMFEQGPGRGPAPIPGLAVPSGRAERRGPHGLQPPVSVARPAALAAGARAPRDRLPLGDIRRAPQHPRARRVSFLNGLSRISGHGDRACAPPDRGYRRLHGVHAHASDEPRSRRGEHREAAQEGDRCRPRLRPDRDRRRRGLPLSPG